MLQRERYRGVSRVRCNAHAAGRWLDTHTPVDSDARDLLAAAAERSGLSARAYHRVLKVARTIADLDDSPTVAWPHVAEALRYRPLESRDADPQTGTLRAVPGSSDAKPDRVSAASALNLPRQSVTSPDRSRHAMAERDAAPTD